MGSLAGTAGVNDVNSMPRVSFGSCMLDGDGLGRGEGGRLPLGDACAAAAAVAVASFSSRLPEKDSMNSLMDSTGLDQPVVEAAILQALLQPVTDTREYSKSRVWDLRKIAKICGQRNRRNRNAGGPNRPNLIEQQRPTRGRHTNRIPGCL